MARQGGVSGGDSAAALRPGMSRPPGQPSDQPSPHSAPSITLPKGGGAIRGIGEKFAANPVTGTGSMSVPIAVSPGRSGFGPQLSLSYDSGSGNGPFGFGWSLSLPQITRKTDKGLPQYRDGEESDVFILSGAEDLVPVFKKKPNGEWELDADGRHVIDEAPRDGYLVRRYRPRIEGLFARIERWTRQSDGDIHWRSISKDNILTLYGKNGDSRIYDPADGKRIFFSWLICETRDDKGNAVLYEYKPEDGVGVDLTRAHERNRGDRNDPRRATNRYLKRIHYGNRVPLLDNAGRRPSFLTDAQIQNAGWMFEAVVDYEDHDPAIPRPKDDEEKDSAEKLKRPWAYRQDPFSSYRSGFEVRTTRLCQRVLMFHHFPGEAGVGADCLVRSTDFTYSHEQDPASARNPVYTFLRAVTQSGYKREGGSYLKRSLPPLEFVYSQPVVQDTVEEVHAQSLENVPVGVDGAAYQWTDLHGEGIPGILTEQAGAWFYKRNLSPINPRPGNHSAQTEAKFAPVEVVAVKPNLALAGGQAQFMDLAGDGQPDLVVLDDPMAGLYEHDGAEGWQPFRPFTARLNRNMRDPNLKFVDLDGDGHADVLITEDDAFVWHTSQAEAGFGPARRVAQVLDEEEGPRLVFADGTQSVYLADLSGDGLTDLVRIRNGEVCYWPNLGYSRFGAKVTMDHAPHFDHPDQFDHKRIRLADIDGTGTTDIIYLHRDGVRLYFNQSGNSWSALRALRVFPRVDDLVSIVPTDLLGNGTACLVWSSPLPGDARRPMRYVNLMGGQKPHLLVKTFNNLGAETHVQYAHSTKFYLKDRDEGKAWITKLPFPVHVVERVETYDYVSRNRFVTRYAYHHGYFDGVEREFRGFGMVEQFDTEEFAALSISADFPVGDNVAAASHVPPAHTKTWFHTGVYLGRDHVSDFFAGMLDARDRGEYYREPAWRDDDAEAKKRLLPDTVLPPKLTLEEEREACRALKGSMLRQEVYALDGTPKAEHPYTVVEQNLSIDGLQPRGENRHAVFFAHPREAIAYHYERNPADPRIQHALTLEVDPFGNVLKEVTIGYGRRQPDPSLPSEVDRDKQTKTLVTYTENRVTDPIDAGFADDYRTPLPCETRTYELTGYTLTGAAGRFRHGDFVQPDVNDPKRLAHIFDSEINYEEQPTNGKQRRLIEHLRTLYRENKLTALLELGKLESLALAGESYKLAFAPGLLAQVYQRPRSDQPLENLLPDAPAVLGSQAPDGGGYVDLDGNGHWWIPSGRIFYREQGTPADELSEAQTHFFLPRRFEDPFGNKTYVRYAGDLLVLETEDALGNKASAGERDAATGAVTPGIDYRVLQPKLVMDPNRNRSEVVFDALGMVVGTAVMGKPEDDPRRGDSLEGFESDLPEQEVQDHIGFPLGRANPPVVPHEILKKATTRLVYDLFAYHRTKNDLFLQPAIVYTMARETHDSDLGAGEKTRIQHGFSYSDGFGQEIQKKIQAEPGPLVEGGQVVNPRWVSSGWTIFNNKGKPVRQYEPFFDDTHNFKFGHKVGVSPILFYDPVERVVATLHPNHSYEKVVFDSWRQATFDVNDTVTLTPSADDDVKGFFLNPDGTPRIPSSEYLPTWHGLRTDPLHAVEFAARYPDAIHRSNETTAATKAAAHANTPTTAYFDSLGRPFLTVAHNKVVCPNHDLDGTEGKFHTRVELDIEGNQRAVRDAIVQAGDALGRVVMRYDYDMLGNRIHQSTMEAGARWIVNDVAGKPIRAWDSRSHTFRSEYDPLRRPLRSFVTGADPANPNQELLSERLIHGEQHPEAELRNVRGRVYLHLDQAGAAASEVHDFKGNPLRATRRLAREYKQAVGWSTVNAVLPANATAKLNPATLEAALAPLLEADTFASRTSYDALNRPIELIAPHSNAPGSKINTIRPTYNEANLLNAVEANLREEVDDATGLLKWTLFVTNIDYNAKGQRELIQYGNGAETRYRYDRETFRLIHLYTRRGAAFTGDCENPAPPPDNIAAPETPPANKRCGLQNLRYNYDPVGNITSIRDDGQQRIFFDGQLVEPSNDYTYDAIYRLIQATGREHLGQTGGQTNPTSAPDPFNGFHTRLHHPGDGNAIGTYIERYVYDAVGNFVEMQHRGSDPLQGWTRTYAYEEASLIEPAKQSNRLSRTTVGNGNQITELYVYDAHGNMIRMPHLGGAHPAPNLHWDYRDQLRQADLGGGGTAYYVYDAAGQRERKAWEKSANLIEERIYLGGFEIFRRHSGAIGADTATLERETLHIMDDKQRIALVETRTLDTAGDDPAPLQLVRYQFGNHLGSASLELDDQAQIISYEEYTPYGSTSYQAVRSQTETPKRYRYTGKERDEESGFYYHGARYYAPWLGRWTGCDPKGISDGPNLYGYGHENPLRYGDPTGTQCDPEIASCPVLMGNWTYGEPVPDRASLGHNVQREHPIQVNLRSEQRGGQYTRGVSAARGEQTVLVETGRGYFHTELGPLQAEINARVRAGIITGEAELIEATREAYRLAARAAGVEVNAQALDRAMVSNLAVLSETVEQTRAELLQAAGPPSTITEASMERAFSDPSPPQRRATTSAVPASEVEASTGTTAGAGGAKPSSLGAKVKFGAALGLGIVLSWVTTKVSMEILEDKLGPQDKDAAEAAMGVLPPGVNILVAGLTRFMGEAIWEPVLKSYYVYDPEELRRTVEQTGFTLHELQEGDRETENFMYGRW